MLRDNLHVVEQLHYFLFQLLLADKCLSRSSWKTNWSLFGKISDSESTGFRHDRRLFLDNRVYLSKRIYRFIIDSLSRFLLNFLLFLEMIAIGNHKILLRLLDPLELALDDRIRHVFVATCSLHAVDVEGVDHLFLCCGSDDRLSDWLLVVLLRLFSYFYHFFQETIVMDVVGQQDGVSSSYFLFGLLLNLSVLDRRSSESLRLKVPIIKVQFCDTIFVLILATAEIANSLS